MGRRRGKSTGGEAFLVVVGLLAAAAVAAYRFIVDNAPTIGGIALLCGCAYLLFRVISNARNTASLSLRTAPPELATGLRRGLGSDGTLHPRDAPARWIRAQERVNFGRTEIVGGLFYYGDWLPVANGATTQYAINPRLSSSAPRADVEGSSMPYWPSYSEISPAARRAFLDWLGGGRRDPAYGIGHIFIFFYGLEHRLFVEGGDDAATLVSEVQRLLNIYGANHSFHGYATNFLSFAAARSGASPETPVISPERATGPEIDLSTRLYLGEQLAKLPVLSAEDALRWVLAVPDVYLRTPAVRCFDEFVALWRLRFAKRY